MMNSFFWELKTLLDSGDLSSKEIEPKITEISAAFVRALKSAPVTSLSEDENALVREMVLYDWQSLRLLKSVPEFEIFNLLTAPYADETVRMYMLLVARRLEDCSLMQRIALYFFENDQSTTLRDSAFELLAKCKWERTEFYAKEWWSSEDPVKKIVALNVLQISRSTLLNQYLTDAEVSNDKALRSAARGVRTLQQLSKPE